MSIDELKILHGLPIDLGVVKVYPLTCHEVTLIGQDKYNQMLNLVLFKDENIQIDNFDVSEYETAILWCHSNVDIKTTYLEALAQFFKEPVQYHEQGFFYLGSLEDSRIISKDIFLEIITVIQEQNFIKQKAVDEEEFQPHDEAAQELVNKIKQFRQKVKEQNREDGLNLSDIISIVAAYSENINLFNVWDLTIYQLYNSYIRITMKDTYESQLYLLPHSDPSKSPDIKHWAVKIQK